MYKINMYDQNMVAFCTGYSSYFVESLEDFEENWKPKVGEKTFETYEKSKAGYFANDFMGGGGDCDMVITDLGAEFLEKKTLVKEDFTFDVVNGWRWSSTIFAQKCILDLGLLRFQGETYIVAKYRMEGFCGESHHGNRFPYSEGSIYGNPVLNLVQKSDRKEYQVKKENGCWDPSAPMETFAEDTLDSFVWHIVEKRESIYSIELEKRDDWEKNWHKLTKRQLERLFLDIPGEAG